MPNLIPSSPPSEYVLDRYQQGLTAALAANYALAIFHLTAVLAMITPLTWPVIYRDAAFAISTAYMAENQGDAGENARLAIYWRHVAQSLQLPVDFPA